MYDSYVYETKIIDVAAYPYSKEPLFAIIILFALLILYVVNSRWKQSDENTTINGYIANYNVLGLPVEPLANEQHSQKGILFNTSSEIGLLNSFLYCILAFGVFGAIVLFLENLFGSTGGCIIM